MLGFGLSSATVDVVGMTFVRRPAGRIAVIAIVEKSRTYALASRLAKKGWLHRTRAGQYEPLLGESAGIVAANPWPALSSWKVPYYVGLASAAHEHNLTPDRPGAVQVCVRSGTSAPSGWRELGIALVPRRVLDLDGTELAHRHAVPIRLAGIEKTLLDAAGIPGRVGGIFGLSRIVARAADRADWVRFATLARNTGRGIAAARRIGALVEILDLEVPGPLDDLAGVEKGTPLVYLASTSSNGRRGRILPRWRVLVNASPDSIREEVRR